MKKKNVYLQWSADKTKYWILPLCMNYGVLILDCIYIFDDLYFLGALCGRFIPPEQEEPLLQPEGAHPGA